MPGIEIQKCVANAERHRARNIPWFWLSIVLPCVMLTFRVSVSADEPEVSVRVPRVTVQLVRQAKVPAGDSGIVEQIAVQRGSVVRKGQVLAVLNSDRQQLDLNATLLALRVAELRAEDETSLQTAQAQLAEARSARKVKEIALQIAEAEAKSDVAVEIAAAETRLRQLELDRAQGARKSFKGSISEAQIDRLTTSVAKGELELQQAQQDHLVAALKPKAERAAIEQKEDEIRRFEALVRQSEREQTVAALTRDIRSNEVELAKYNLRRRQITAPFDGVVVEVGPEEGEWIEQGMMVVRIVSLSVLSAEGLLPVDDASLDLVGRPVTIEIRAGDKTHQLPGKVTFVSPEVEPVNQRVRFSAEFQNADRIILPGMTGSLLIH